MKLKNIGSALLMLALLSSASLVLAKHFWRGETLSLVKVKSRWGNDPFIAEKFRTAQPAARAKMASSLLQGKKAYIGVDRGEIRKILGDFDGFYFSDMFPTYMIELGRTVKEESWQIVFLLDRNEKVSDVIIHKNCCDSE